MPAPLVALRSNDLLDTLRVSRAVRSTASLAPPQAVDLEHDTDSATASGAWRGGGHSATPGLIVDDPHTSISASFFATRV